MHLKRGSSHHEANSLAPRLAGGNRAVRRSSVPVLVSTATVRGFREGARCCVD